MPLTSHLRKRIPTSRVIDTCAPETSARTYTFIGTSAISTPMATTITPRQIQNAIETDNSWFKLIYALPFWLNYTTDCRVVNTQKTSKKAPFTSAFYGLIVGFKFAFDSLFSLVRQLICRLARFDKHHASDHTHYES